MTLGGSASATYAYDGDGRRTEMSGNGLFWWESGGRFLAKMGLGGAVIVDCIYFGKKHIAVAHGTSISYVFQDVLGGEHILTNGSGVVCNDIPFGGETDYTANCDPSYKFADMEREDQNSANLHYAMARYYNNRLGRFLVPDCAAKPTAVRYAMFGEPQSLNLYSYVRNNPLAKCRS